MTPISVLRRPATVAYGAVRTPLALLESRLPNASKLRAGLSAGLRRADSWVGSAAAHAAPPQPSDDAPAAPTEPTAPPEPAHAAPADPWEDQDAARQAIVEAVRENQPDVGELADPNLDVAEVQAQLRAKHALQEHERAQAAAAETNHGS